VPALAPSAGTTNEVGPGQDLAAVMRLALEEERQGRQRLAGELARTREGLSEREKQAQTLREQLASRQQEAQRLEARETQLRQQVASAQTNLRSLNRQLQASSDEAVISQQKLAALQAELRKQAEQAAALQSQLAQLALSNRVVLDEKQRLAGQLQVAEAEKRSAGEQVARMTQEVQVERAERARLADGVKVLAQRSGELAQEVRENRPLAANTIFYEFLTNRVEASLSASRSGWLGVGANRHRDTETVLATDGTNIFAMCPVQETPLVFATPGTDWEALSGSLARNTARVAIGSLSFHLRDPRVALMAVTPEEARQLGCKVYRLSADPFKFQDAVLVGAREGYYGECKFQIDPATADYVKLDRNFLNGLFGKFNPSRGDLVFSRSGELLGMMANGTYCLRLRDFRTLATVAFGPDVRAQRTGTVLARLDSLVTQLPPRLQ
jgi:hypothetical protein